jgi:hypothetical protein
MSDPLAAARRLISAGRTDLAQRELHTVLATDPDNGGAHTLKRCARATRRSG